jgi:outer membrane protein assembly factor BamB
VFVAEQAGVVRALKAMTAEPVWIYSTGSSVIQSPLTVVPSGEACCGGILLVGTASGVLHALGLKDGSARWAHQSEAQSSGVSITAAPVASTTGSQVIFGGDNGFLHSLETISGREMWKFRTVAAVKGCLAAHPAGTTRKNVFCDTMFLIDFQDRPHESPVMLRQYPLHPYGSWRDHICWL